jgi:hypothetical protein
MLPDWNYTNFLRSFVTDKAFVENSGSDAAILEAAIAMVNSLEIPVVIEGVEKRWIRLLFDGEIVGGALSPLAPGCVPSGLRHEPTCPGR